MAAEPAVGSAAESKVLGVIEEVADHDVLDSSGIEDAGSLWSEGPPRFRATERCRVVLALGGLSHGDRIDRVVDKVVCRRVLASVSQRVARNRLRPENDRPRGLLR